MTTTTIASLGQITRRNGLGGNFALFVEVTYPNAQPSPVTFIGSTFGGPVIMLAPAVPDGLFVTDPGRFGTFGPEWVTRFFS